jgi:hypothetical protein
VDARKKPPVFEVKPEADLDASLVFFYLSGAMPLSDSENPEKVSETFSKLSAKGWGACENPASVS